MREYIDGIRFDIFKLLKVKSCDVRFPGENTYDGQVAIKSAKIDDLKQIIRHVPDQHKQFYNNILARKTKETVNEEEVSE